MIITVTGATGFLGNALCRALEKKGHVVYKFSSSNLDLRGDISLPRCDLLYHIGGNSRVYLAKQKPMYDFEVNALGTVKVIEAVIKSRIPKIVLTSSNSVYGDLVAEDEKCPTGQNSYGSFYGLSKLTSELYLKEYAEYFGFEYVIFRPSNFYGPGMVKNVIIDLINAFLENRDTKIGLTFDSKIDFIYIDDLVSAYCLAMGLKDEILNLSYGVSTQIKDVVEYVSNSFDKKVKIQEGTNKVIIETGNKKLCSMGWKPEVDIKTGIRNTVEDFKRNAEIRNYSKNIW